jgi:mono/diheme cytochrome c family protein
MGTATTRSAWAVTGVTARCLMFGLVLCLMFGLPGPAWAQGSAVEDAASATAEDVAISEEAVARFETLCAQCHGSDGSGTGPAILDRPARSFMDGGFSFGNTPAAIARTLATGIPGTPMPGFGDVLDESQRLDLARYVLTLGPPIEEVAEIDTIMTVTDRPLIVRGILPPITEQAEINPRGLLVGTTNGFTYEYRTDDVRLLGIRQGDFVRRTDWNGRGGTPLQPLGRLVHVFSDGNPPPTFADAEGTPLAADLKGTLSVPATSLELPEGIAWVNYALLDGDEVLGSVSETSWPVTCDGISGFVRRFGLDLERTVRLGLGDIGHGAVRSVPIIWYIDQDDEDSPYVFTGVTLTEGSRAEWTPLGCTLVLEPGPGRRDENASARIITIFSQEWLDEARRAAIAESCL